MYGVIQPQEGTGAPPHHPDVSLRGAKRRGNLGKALPIYTECRRTQSLSNLTVAALSERHGGLQYAPHCLYGARLSDLSLRGAKRRGNLAEHGRTTGKPSAKSQLPSRDCHVGLRPPRNDKSGGRCGRRGTQKFATANGAQGTPLQTQSVHTILTAACTNCKCLPEIATAPLGPRNDKPLASTILTAACTGCKCAAGRGMPLPYKPALTRPAPACTLFPHGRSGGRGRRPRRA